MKRIWLFMLLLGFAAGTHAQYTDTTFLKTLLQNHPEVFDGILKHPHQNEVQILYTRITRDANNQPHFTSYSYRLNPRRYFYPASTVKLPTLIFALEKLNELKIKGLSRTSTMITDSSYAGQTRVTRDTSSASGLPSVENYVKKILLVSDNDAYNRLYEFVGRAEINQKLKKYGLNQTRIVGRLAVGDGGESARHTNQIRFFNGSKLVYIKPAMADSNKYPMYATENLQQGKGYLDRNDKLVMQPFDFSDKNNYPLADQQAVLRRLLFPETFAPEQRFKLTDADYRLIYRYMSMFPTESEHPAYHRPDYFPAFCKFLYYGADSSAVIDPNIRIFNKVGDSYGYDIDNAYIIDFKTKTEFLLSAVIQSNEDGIYNDDKYEYTTVCLPFLKNLAQLIMKYERSCIKAYPPNLKRYKFKY